MSSRLHGNKAYFYFAWSKVSTIRKVAEQTVFYQHNLIELILTTMKTLKVRSLITVALVDKFGQRG